MFRATKKLAFPLNRGVTGLAFQHQKIICQNSMALEKTFTADVDN
jgi:hypothetical protein